MKSSSCTVEVWAIRVVLFSTQYERKGGSMGLRAIDGGKIDFPDIVPFLRLRQEHSIHPAFLTFLRRRARREFEIEPPTTPESMLAQIKEAFPEARLEIADTEAGSTAVIRLGKESDEEVSAVEQPAMTAEEERFQWQLGVLYSVLGELTAEERSSLRVLYETTAGPELLLGVREFEAGVLQRIDADPLCPRQTDGLGQDGISRYCQDLGRYVLDILACLRRVFPGHPYLHHEDVMTQVRQFYCLEG